MKAGADKPVFTEVKQRVGRVIRKHRACLRREVLEGQHWAEPISGEFLTAYDNEREQENLMLFSELSARLRAEPKIGVRYTREAYVSSLEEPVRITLDRDITFAHSGKSERALGRRHAVALCGLYAHHLRD